MRWLDSTRVSPKKRFLLSDYISRPECFGSRKYRKGTWPNVIYDPAYTEVEGLTQS